jgi:hypothetical protein
VDCHMFHLVQLAHQVHEVEHHYVDGCSLCAAVDAGSHNMKGDHLLRPQLQWSLGDEAVLEYRGSTYKRTKYKCLTQKSLNSTAHSNTNPFKKIHKSRSLSFNYHIYIDYMENTIIFFTNVGFTHWYTLTVVRHLLILIPLAIWWAVKHYLSYESQSSVHAGQDVT